MWRRDGFTLLELVLVITIIGVLVAVAVQRLLILRVEAERAAVEQVLGGLRAAVAIHTLSLITSGRDAELSDLSDSNPMEYLLEAPFNYRGEVAVGTGQQVEPGSWYFDPGERRLAYRPRYGRYLRHGAEAAEEIRFRVHLVFEDRDGDGSFDPDVDGVGGARVVAEEPYEWVSPGEQRG